MKKFLGKVPWGIFAGASGILCFYLTVAVFGIQFVFAQVNGQTGQAATIFDTWWQTLIFVFDIVCVVVFVCTLVLFIWKKVSGKGGVQNEKVVD